MTSLTTKLSADAVAPSGPSVAQLKRDLQVGRLRKQISAFALIDPLTVFLLVTFVAPIATLLTRAVEDPEISTTLPGTVAALTRWNGTDLPPDAAYTALAIDLGRAVSAGTIGTLADRLNTDLPGFRSVLLRTSRALPRISSEGAPSDSENLRQTLVRIDERWGQTPYWRVIAQNSTFFRRAISFCRWT